MTIPQLPTDLPDFLKNAGQIPYRRIALWSTVVTGLIVLLVALNFAKNVYTDFLWFDAVGYRDVFTKILTTKIWLFFAGAGFFTVAFAVNMAVARRLSRGDEPALLPPETILMIRGLTTIGVVLLTFIFAIVFGAVASGQWENWLGFINLEQFVDSVGVPISDPLNGHNPSFYIFSLPFMRFIQTWLLGLIVMLILGALSIYAVGFSLRGFRLDFSRGVKIHVAMLAALLALFVAWSYWFDTKELVLSARGLGGSLFGASATDVVAKRFALQFMMGVTAISAVLAVISAFRPGYVMPLAAFGLWLAGVILVLTIYPLGYQRFSVEPNELVRETPYIEANIAATRDAFQLDQIETRPFPISDELPDEALIKNPALVDNIRVWDHRPLRDTFNQIQFFRPYYTFPDVDVDRYSFDGQPRQVMLSARELIVENLPDEAQSWVAKRLQYTHGYGASMSPVNTFTGEGRPEFFLKDIPPKGLLEVSQPEIYYGERSTNYAVVNTNTLEFDFPSQEDVPQFTSYSGEGGVQLSSFVRRAAFAWRFADLNLLISDQITSDSRMMFNRNIQERVLRIAPFLDLDSDPYLVISEGKLWWIQDAYTTTRRFPYSQPFNGQFNYIRNSVKVVIDAFHGTTDFYLMDPEDGIVRTYGKIFPSLFKPIDAMPEGLREHIRYPEGLFNVQESVYRTYHITNPQVFFSKEDLWSRPTEIFYESPQSMEAYYVIMPLPGEVEPEFLLLLPFTPLDSPNLVAWLAARNDGDAYGKLTVFTFPKDRQVDGPAQVEARIDNDPLISQQFTLWGQQGSQIIRGNLLLIPIGESLLYVEPVYLQASTLNFPELKRVIVAIGSNAPVMEPTLERALEVALGNLQPTTPPGGLSPPPSGDGDGDVATPTPEPPTPTPGPGTPTPAAPDLDELIRQIEQLLEQLQGLSPGE